jgi:hypothetical protein
MKKNKPVRDDGLYVPPPPPKGVPTNQLSQAMALEYNRGLRFPKLMGPSDKRGSDRSEPSTPVVRKNAIHKTDGGSSSEGRAPMEFGHEQSSGPTTIRIARPYDHTPGPASPWEFPSKRRRQK